MATPEDIILAAHRHERHAQLELGLDDAAVVAHAPRELRATGTRAAYVEGLRRAARQTRDERVRSHLAMADALYWCLARRSVYILRPRRHLLAADAADAEQDGLLWLLKAAQRFKPHLGTWKRHAIAWLMALRVSNHDHTLSGHDREVLQRLHRLRESAAARGEPMPVAKLAALVGRSTDDVHWLLSVGRDATPLEDADFAGQGDDPTAPDHQHLHDLDRLIAHLTPQEAWGLARQVGLWGTPRVSHRVIADELGLPICRTLEVLRDARRHAASARGVADPSLWPFDRRGLRWALRTHHGDSVPADIAAHEGVTVEQVEQAINACIAAAEVTARAPRQERVA